MKILGATVTITPPGGAATNINVTSAQLAASGTPSALAGFEGSWAATGPTGHVAPGRYTLRILSASASPYPLGADVAILLQLGAATTTRRALTVEADSVTPHRPSGQWLHTLTLTSNTQTAMDTRIGQAQPLNQFLLDRWAALSVIHNAVLANPGLANWPPDEAAPAWPSPVAVGGSQINKAVYLRAEAADVSLYKAVTEAVAGIGGQVYENRDGKLTWSVFGYQQTYPAGDRTKVWLWWAPQAVRAALTVTLNPAKLTAAAATLDRTAHISKVDITYNDPVSGNDQTQTVEDLSSVYPSSLSVPTALAGTGAPLAALVAIANTIVHAPVEPVLDTVKIPANVTIPVSALALLVSAQTGRVLVELDPQPGHCGRFHILDGASFTLNDNLDLIPALQLTPATLYGLRPYRFHDFAAFVDRANEWVFTENGNVHAARCNELKLGRPRTY